MFKITTNLRVDKLVKKIASKSSRDLIIRLYAEEIAEESKKYITQGKVKPSINPSTKDHRQLRGRTQDKPLFFNRKLRDSIKPTNKGVSFASYGQLHRDGYTVANSKYAEKHNFAGRAVPPREFIAYFADESIKKRIDKRVRRRYMDEMSRR
mgnify:CR=1 FL=1